MTKKRLTDDEFMEVYSELRAWKGRDAARSIKYQRLIRISNRKRKIRHAVILITGVAAVALILFKIPWLVFKTQKNPNSLYSQFYEPYRFATDYRDGSDNTMDMFKSAVIAYRTLNFVDAEILSDSLTGKDNANPDYLLLNGLIKQANGKFDIAITQYLKLIANGGSYAQHAQWYLALIYLKQGKLIECNEQLDSLRLQSGTFYRDKSDRLKKLIGLTQS
ncbi:MAG: hypothetical protein WC699_12925 [Bacteroidales bacterium]|jgi:tetratricopeptide (TPR) repeat protein